MTTRIHPDEDDLNDKVREWLQSNPPYLTRAKTLLLLILTLLMAAVDIASVSWAMKQRYIDPQGNFSGSWFELMAISCMTLCMYFVIGLLLERGYKWPACALYLIIVCLLTLSLASTETARFQEAWNSVTVDGTGVLSGQAGDAPAPKGAPTWFLVICDILLAFCLTIAGLLFIWFKRHLAECVKEWKFMRIMVDRLEIEEQRLAREDAVNELEAEYADLNNPDVRLRLRNQAVAQVLKLHSAKILARRREAATVLGSVRSSEADKRQAQAIVDRAQECLAAIERFSNGSFPKKFGGPLMMVLLALAPILLMATGHAQSTAELCRTAPVFQLLIDASGSSPARDPGFISAVEPLVEQKLRAMPACSQVMVVSIGDAVVMPLMLRTRVQMRTTRDGATMDDIARGLRQFLNCFPSRIKDHEQGRSEIIGSLADASRNVNPNARASNVIVVLSDMIENSGLADCERRICRLPDKPKLNLGHVDVTVYGAGLGLPSPRALALTKAWEGYLAQAGAKADLHRTF